MLRTHVFPHRLELSHARSVVAGIDYDRRNDLPEGTIRFVDQTLNVVDSTFEQLAAFGQASLILLNSNVFFSNVTFDSNYQSQAGAILVNQTSNATVVNSVFNNNFGYQAGAISVGCKPPSPPPPLSTPNHQAQLCP